MPTLEFQFENLADIPQWFDLDYRPGLQQCGNFMVQATARNILSETSPNGVPFAPLSPSYAKRKKGPGILREELDLFRATQVDQVTETEVIVVNTDFKAPFHQRTGPRDARPSTIGVSAGGAGKIPERPFMGFSEQDADACVRIMAESLASQLQ